MANLSLYVKYNRAKPGDLKIGDQPPDIKLYYPKTNSQSISNQSKQPKEKKDSKLLITSVNLQEIIDLTETPDPNRPLLICGASWT